MAKGQNRLWFKRRRYGWGWTPVTWQGRACVIVLLAVIIFSAMLLLPAKPAQPTTQRLVIFFLIAFSVILFLFGISYAKGPLPHWRWGKKPDDNLDEDA